MQAIKRRWGKLHIEWLDALQGLDPTEMRVALAYVVYHDANTGEAFPSADKIAEMLNLEKHKVPHVIDRLVEVGFLTLVKPHSGRSASVYRLPIPDKTNPSSEHGQSNQDTNAAGINSAWGTTTRSESSMESENRAFHAWHVKVTKKNQIDALNDFLDAESSKGGDPVYLHVGEKSQRIAKGLCGFESNKTKLEEIFSPSGVRRPFASDHSRLPAEWVGNP